MAQADRTELRVVLFSGGRGSGALAGLLAADTRVSLTVAINGYDDGASTGEIRRFLGDALGPSDFRKNASRFARLRNTCSPAVVEFLDRRLPPDATADSLDAVTREFETAPLEASAANVRAAVVERLRRFSAAQRSADRAFDFRGASVGNFVFAGSFLACGRRFNEAVDDYCGLLGLPVGLIDNVTDGTNAFLVAVDGDGHVLGSEGEIVDDRRRSQVREIFLIDRRLEPDELTDLERQSESDRQDTLSTWSVWPPLNARLVRGIAEAHLIIYAPGTQHSSLFPSYLTPGLGMAIAANLTATKMLITNIQEDSEIAGRSAVDLLDRAIFYLREKGRSSTPVPCLITHSLINDPASDTATTPYVPLGSLESLEDPRLVRVANYEDGATGRHDAAKVLAPYIDAFVAREAAVPRVAVVLTDTESPNKLVQTLLEMVRGGVHDRRVALEIFHGGATPFEPSFVAALPFAVRCVSAETWDAQDQALRAALSGGRFDYVVLFDSSGMYNGEDVAGLVSHLTSGRLDAVWGSRRLSVRDIRESYRLRYKDKVLQGVLSAVGSHTLSLQFLALYGRYVADTLSGARALRIADALSAPCPLADKLANHYFLSTLLRRQAEILEVPVQFFGITPQQVRRTTTADGVRALLIAFRERLRKRAPSARET